MRVLVTGASGYVGGAAVRELLARGHRVVALVHSAPLSSGVSTCSGSLLDEASLRAALDGVDGVVHLAARTAVRESVANPVAAWRTNVAGTLNLLGALPHGASLVFASTGSVYGTPTRQPIAETAPCEVD